MSRDFAIEPGIEVLCKGEHYLITAPIDLRYVQCKNTTTGEFTVLELSELSLPTEEAPTTPPVVSLARVDTDAWDVARLRLEKIKPLLEQSRRRRADVAPVAEALGVDVATLYRWIKAYRATHLLSVLLPKKPTGGRGKTRLDDRAEAALELVIETFYKKDQQRTVKATAAELARLCRQQGIDPPHVNTVRTRIQRISDRERLHSRGHKKLARDVFTARPGHYAEAQRPLDVVQIDHTWIDVVVVDEKYRLNIGRPFITLAFDVYSRMVVGFHIGLDTPGAHGTGLTLSHAILPKETWLAERGITNEWPCWGFCRILHMDNAAEFHGEVVTRACEQYDIEIDYRPPLTPNFGGHVERMLGTLSKAFKTLPGATFSNPVERGEYPSEKRACMTLGELEKWTAEYITGVYHEQFHEGIKMAPIKRWKDAILGDGDRVGIGVIPRPADPQRIRLDFMPFEERTVQRYGVQINHFHYWNDLLTPYVNESDIEDRKHKRKFIFRYDPRDLSTVYFWEPDLQQYFPISYADTSHPPVNLWEARAVRKQLVSDGRAAIDEQSIFQSLERLRIQEDEAVLKTKRARRSVQRRREHSRIEKPKLHLVESQSPTPLARAIVPFEIEDA